MRNSRFAGVGLTLTVALAVAGCGGGDGGGGGGAAQQQQGPKNAKQISADQAKPQGNINWCIGKDTSGAYRTAVKTFNQQNPGATVKLRELPESADEQRTQLVQRLRAQSAECDVLGLDVIWTAEFAAQGWLYDVTDAISDREGEFIESTVATARYADRVWAIPFNSNAGFLYFRTDQAQGAPQSWQQAYEQAAQTDGLVYQGASYEGLTVNFLELLYSNGGRVLSEDGQQPQVDSPEAREVLQFMVDGVQNKAVPKAVTTYQEEEARRAFEAGNATFMRNWPYAYALAQESKIDGKFDITTFPKFNDKEGAGVLGGYNLGISAFSQNAGGALAFANFLTSPEFQVTVMTEASTPAVLTQVYDDPKVRKAMPFADRMLQAIRQAEPRPVSPVYPQISEAIYTNVHQALTGSAPPDQAVKKMQQGIQQALQTF